MRALPTLLTLAILVAGCTSPPDPDRDGDGIDDHVELQGAIIEIERLNGTERRAVTSDPGLTDTDGDGVPDGEELLVRNTDPRDVDTDGDGLLDGHDMPQPDDTIANAWRLRGILAIDGVFLGEMDVCPPGAPQLKGNAASSDRPLPDQLTDGEELRGWSIRLRGEDRHVTSDPCVPDTDQDGLVDHDEKAVGSDPRDDDTDGDGVRDSLDADPLADLQLQFTDLAVQANATSVRIVILLGDGAAELRWPGNGSAQLQVPDQTPDRASLEARMVITAEEGTTGDPLALFDDPRGAIVSIDLLKRTVSGAEVQGENLSFSGMDGSMTMRWATIRR